MTAMEVMAIARLRQWAVARSASRTGKATCYRREGWRERRATESDARLVQVIDFERILGELTVEEQIVLVQRYRDGEPDERTAQLLGCSKRKIFYVLANARRALAEGLDRAHLL